MRRLTTLAIATVFAMAACSSAPTTSPSETPGPLSSPTTTESALPTASTAPSASPSAAPSATPAIGTLDVFPPGAAVVVAVKELNLRKNHSTSAKRVDTLNRGDVVVISPLDNVSFGYGPVKNNGYTWYPVMVTRYHNGTLPALPTEPIGINAGPPTWGWVAADDGERQFLTALAPRCPTTVDLTSVQGMLPAERLACFGEPIVLEGTFGCAECGATTMGIFKPNWLASPLSFGFLSVNVAERLGPLTLRFPPSGPVQPPVGKIIRVTVHVDDPRATKCTMIEADETGEPVFPVDARTAVLQCREQLVVESYQVLGADPSFPLG